MNEERAARRERRFERHCCSGIIATLLALFVPLAVLADSHWRPTAAQQVIVSMTAKETLRLLGTVARSVSDGRSCRESSYRRLGLNKHDGELYYIVRCKSGDKFVIRVKRDADASTGVMSCALVKLATGLDCRELRPEDYIDPR